MASLKISIVVPFHNVERYISECLASLARQTLADLEVIMVDDGSPDGCAVIAKEFAARDSRFHLIQQENRGLGPARNRGVTHARGEYLCFADSDDVLPPQAYELMVASLDRTGSDFATGDVRTFGAMGVRPSWLPARLYATDRPGTHVRQDHRLLWDRSAWNKVFRRSFWDAQGFAFPAGLYEDVPVTVPAHVKACAVDVVPEVVYYYRVREGGEPSITQRKHEPAHLASRIAQLQPVTDFFEREAPELATPFHKTVVQAEFRLAMEALLSADDDGRAQLLALVADYLDRMAPEAYGELGPSYRLKCALAARRDLPALVKALQAEKERGEPAVVVSRGRLRRRLYHDVLFPGAKLPEELFRAEDDLSLRGKVDAVTWRDDVMVIEGHAHIDRLPMGEQDDLQVWLRNTRTDERLPLDCRRTRRPDVTAASRQSAVSYDGSGFRAELPSTALKSGNRWMPAVWELCVAVGSGGLCREGPLRGEGLPPVKGLQGRRWIRPLFTESGRFQVRVRKPRTVLVSCRYEEGELRLKGWIRAGSPPIGVVATRRRDGLAVEAAVEGVATDGRHWDFHALLPTDQLAEEPRGQVIDTMLWAGEQTEWALSVITEDGRFRLAADDLQPVRARAGQGEAVLAPTRYGDAALTVRPCLPYVTHVAWSPAGELVLDGGRVEGPCPLELRRLPEQDAHTVVAAWTGTTFRAVLDPVTMPGAAAAAPLAAGTWDLVAGDGFPVLMDCPPAAALDRGELRFTPLRSGNGVLRLAVRQAEGEREEGRYARRRLEREIYPKLRRQPTSDSVVFDSWEGKQCSDSPRAIFERLRDSGLDLVWVRREGRFETPEGGRCVVRDSEAHYEALARARHVVANSTQPRWYRKRKGQIYLQTWHGTPLKRIGFDMEKVHSLEGAAYLDRFAADVAQWDFLISPNPFSTPVFRRAFRYEGEILETGYPRNDLLLAPDREQRALEARRRLGVPDGTRVVLYAPTWRDDDHVHGRYRFDLKLDLAHARSALGADHVVLVRGHSNVSARLPRDDGFTIDVSRYPDVADLYLVADVLVTDYSSAMFDFAVTGKPILLFTYDLERYRDELRGFSFDLAECAPGPLLRRSEEVVEALAALDRTAEAYASSHAAFTARFCPLDDGAATERVVRRVWGDI
ncbi:hypothetical protein GCM10010404_22210 [Nonomuraea africana]|uniref:CDP-glycerol glycerophosphotransferase n=1 Tax=Nonomuraea africana TaxID=46171 RepID=A0ABR9KU04_9ACTN|nr:bifunctional glycosyltransferase family 2 protein/CDP-glycerol:glycerophosphate glycerophosphotransferase [Nonomuraea africana]MBE1565480.1 CDP-glycerol glycerophosphotransferase [Nonomuraea africana]